MIEDMKIGFRLNTEEQDYFPRQDYREFFERVLQQNLKEKKFPFFVTFCPFHEDRKTPNFSINIISGNAVCFACGARKNPLDFILKDGVVNTPNLLTDKTVLAKYAEFEKVPPDQLTLAIEEHRAEQAHQMLLNLPLMIKKLLKDRTWTLETIKRFKIGYFNGALTFPIYDKQGGISSLKFHKKFQTDGCSNQLYPWSAVINNKSPYVIITEGEPDTITAIQHGFNAVTQTCGAHGWDPEFTRLFRKKKVYIGYDPDVAGISGAKTLANVLWTDRMNSYIIKWPEWMSEDEDLTDFFARYNKTPQDFQLLMENAKSVLEYK
jgi:DNA primase